MNVLYGLFQSNRAVVIQFFEYLLGGSTYFISGYLIFALCYSGFGWSWLPAKLVSDVVGWTLNYLVQRYWVFENPQLKRHEGATMGKYGAIMILNLGLDYLIIWGLNSIGISPYIGFVLSAGFFTVWNYLWYRFWVFYAKQRVSKEVV